MSEMQEKWILTYRDLASGRELKSEHPSENAALIQGKSLGRQKAILKNLEGPNKNIGQSALELLVQNIPE